LCDGPLDGLAAAYYSIGGEARIAPDSPEEAARIVLLRAGRFFVRISLWGEESGSAEREPSAGPYFQKNKSHRLEATGGSNERPGPSGRVVA